MKLKTKRLLLAYALIIIAPMTVYYAINNYMQRNGVQNWPKVKGIVLYSGVEQQKRYKKKSASLVYGKGYTLYYVQRIKYSYRLGDKNYSSTHFSLDEKGSGGRTELYDGTGRKFLDKKQAEIQAAKFPLGSAVDVYYNPKNPQIASLSHSNASFMPIIYAFGFFAFAVLALLIAHEKINPENLPWRKNS